MSAIVLAGVSLVSVGVAVCGLKTAAAAAAAAAALVGLADGCTSGTTTPSAVGAVAVAVAAVAPGSGTGCSGAGDVSRAGACATSPTTPSSSGSSILGGGGAGGGAGGDGSIPHCHRCHLRPIVRCSCCPASPIHTAIHSLDINGLPHSHGALPAMHAWAPKRECSQPLALPTAATLRVWVVEGAALLHGMCR
jgi:hypothetical protein